jgi:thioesterase domain-containing protein
MRQLPNAELVAEHLDATMPEERLSASPAPPADTFRAGVHAAQQPEMTVNGLAEVVAEHGRTLARIDALLAGLIQKQPWAQDESGCVQLPLTRPDSSEAARGTDSAPVIATASTAAQRAIFLWSRISERLSASYNESIAIRIRGRISISKLTRALERLVERHDSLRASFDETGAAMRISPEMNLEVPVTDLSDVTLESERADSLRRLTAIESARPFALPCGPLFRGQIVVLRQDSVVVIFTGHHVICDGWSLDVLVHDFCAFYSEEISGTPASLRPAPSFVKYANEVARREHSPEYAEAKSYWEAKFAVGFPALALPTDFPRATQREYQAKRLDHSIAAPLVNRLRTLAASQGCTFFAIIMGALSIMLARVSRQNRFVLALPTAEQPVVGEPELVGYCVSLLPFLVELRNEETVSAYLARVQEELSSSQDHSSFTLVNLLENLHSAGSAQRVSPIPAGLTSVKRFRPDELVHRDFVADYAANPKAYESFEWYLNVIEAGSGLELHCHYDIALLKRTTVEGWLSELEEILVGIVANPGRKTYDLARLKPVESSPSSKAPVVHSLRTVRNLPKNMDNRLTEGDSLAKVPISIESQETKLLRALLPIWERVLDQYGLCADDNFFEMGGNSIMAARLFASIERDLGITAPLATLYEAPTARELVTVLARDDGRKQWHSLVPIQMGGGRTPFFLVHGAEGNVLLYRRLALHLGQDQPVYGLQSAGLDGHSPIDGNLERVARRYVEEVRQVQPEGPYLLGGYCLGGIIAFEMARQLMAAGHTVGLVALIECFNVGSGRWPLPWHLRVINRFLLNPYFHLRNMLAAEKGSKLDFFREKLLVEIRRAKMSAQVALARARRSWKPRDPEEPKPIKVADVYEKGLAEYVAKPYPGEITLFMPERHLAGLTNRLGGWENVAEGGVRLYSLPISPKGSLTEPYVGFLAELIRGCIDNVEASASTKNATSAVLH